MGTFAMLFHKAGTGIPNEKMEEFIILAHRHAVA